MNKTVGKYIYCITKHLMIAFLLLLISIPVLSSAELKVHFIDVGQGDAILVQCDGENLLIDAGPVEAGDNVNQYLSDVMGLNKIHYVIATHAHDDHLAGMPSALDGLTVGHVYSSTAISSSYWFRTVLSVLKQDGLEISYPAFQDSFQLGGATVRFVNPMSAAENPNDLSLVVLIEYESNTVLLTADIEAEAETSMLACGVQLSADILKVPHHGGNTSCTEAFIRAVSPRIAIISVGTGNPHGHPHMEPLRTLEKYHATIYRTDLFGTIVCTSNGAEWIIEVSKAR